LDVIVTDRCQGCGACLLTCPEHAIRPHGRPLLVVQELCTGCLECIEVCPADAIEARVPGGEFPGGEVPGDGEGS
jgi:NAD-dependent dihydropyrimidine dehydrogenase PreA subunit